MCGIALIVSGVQIDSNSLQHPSQTQQQQQQHLSFSVDDIRESLNRRGPDSVGVKYIFLNKEDEFAFQDNVSVSFVVGEEPSKRDLLNCSQISNYSTETNGSHRVDNGFLPSEVCGEFCFIGATLQLRGTNTVSQPLVDESGNILIYNGEIFGGIDVSQDRNDSEVLMQSLRKCHGGANGTNSITELLSAIKGPWAIIYWQESSKTIWFGRDAFGRRSLLVHWPSAKDPRLLLTSVSPPSVSDCSDEESFWEELPCAVYSISVQISKLNGCLFGELRRHDWTNRMLNELIKWERTSVEPNFEELNVPNQKLLGLQQEIQSAFSVRVAQQIDNLNASCVAPPQAVLNALRESVKRRLAFTTIHQQGRCDSTKENAAPVAVLFSGGLDSMILAALLDECLDHKYEIDLLNVSFDGQSAPDRISARAGVEELRRISSLRQWKLVEIDADLSVLSLESKHVMSLINPAKTYMDLNIGLALWLAAGGDGWINEKISENIKPEYRRVKYKSESRILLVGSGADEQCAGYGRHRTKYRHSSWIGLHEEMKLDMQRIWKRNLGRDDRCISDCGKEARFPFLDEDVIRTLLDIPLWEIANLDQPSGVGDKKVLREVARMLGLHEAAVLPKRAIQFGSRIARESNRKNFGSNRAANQASAGTAVINVANGSN